MMPIYRSPSNRLSEYDYSQEGMYFITICLDRLGFGLDYPIFGKVVEDSVTLNEFGLFVEQQIKQTQVVRPYVEMIGYIVMHDHIHMVIQIHNDGQQHHGRNRRDATLASIDGNNGHEHITHGHEYSVNGHEHVAHGHEHRVPTQVM